jgi:hypothetical protein
LACSPQIPFKLIIIAVLVFIKFFAEYFEIRKPSRSSRKA